MDEIIRAINHALDMGRNRLQWILVEHGRWSMTITLHDADGKEFKFQKIDPNGVMCVSDSQPEDVADIDLPN